jgi:hypothetical protein
LFPLARFFSFLSECKNGRNAPRGKRDEEEEEEEEERERERA